MSLLDVENRVTNLDDKSLQTQHSNSSFFNRIISNFNTTKTIATMKRRFEKMQTQLNQVNTKLTTKNLKTQIAQIRVDIFIRFAFVVASLAKSKSKFLKSNTLSKYKNQNENEHIR